MTPDGAAAALTAREREVAELAAQGMKSREIAARLFVSVRTVDTHILSIYTKTGTHSRVQLLNWLDGNASPAAQQGS